MASPYTFEPHDPDLLVIGHPRIASDDALRGALPVLRPASAMAARIAAYTNKPSARRHHRARRHLATIVAGRGRLTNISLARGAPSLDIIAVDELRRRRPARLRARSRPARSPTAPRPGYPPLLAWIAEKHGVDRRAGDRHQRLDAGRRVPVRAAASSPATSWWSRRPPTTARCSRCATSARRSCRSRSRPTASTWRRSAGGARGGRAADARAHHPQLPEPGRLHAVAGQAAAPARAGAPSTTSRSSRTTRTWSCASRASDLPTMLSLDEGEPRRLRVVVLEDRLPRASGSATWSARADTDRRDPQARHRDLHLAEHGGPGDRERVLRLGRDRRLDRDGQGRAARASRRHLRRARPRTSPTPAS